jgi:large subunit ribosomal protein L24
VAKDSKPSRYDYLGGYGIMAKINPKFLHLPKHKRDQMIGCCLSQDLKQQHKKKSIRVVKGDSVKVMRGEYTGIEGKVEKVNTKRGTLSIEGIQREKVRGGNVKVQIHASNVIVSSLNVEDKYRKDRIENVTTRTVSPSQQRVTRSNSEIKAKTVKTRKKGRENKEKGG